MLSVTLDSLHYFVLEFFRGTAFLGGIALFIYLCFYSFRVNWLQKKWVQPTCILLLTVLGFFTAFDIQLFNGFDKTPVVYAVEDTYQITFTTQEKGEAWVVIDGVEYNDTYAGGRKTESTIHKISVPMNALDAADSYTIYTRAMILRGPYESLQGKTISETFTWKGVNTEDGLNYYAFSDNHLTSKAPAAAASYWGEDLDFLIALGDTANWLDNEEELTNLLYLAKGVDYRIGICHIPLTISDVVDPLLAYKNAWVERLNQMHISILYGGHFHELMFNDAATNGPFSQTSAYTGKTKNTDEYYLADANFPSILVSKRGTTQSCTDDENVFDKHFIGVAASVEGKETVLKFTNESGKIVETVSPWFEGVEYGKEIHVKNVK